MLLVLILTLCYSVSSLDLEKPRNDLKDGNLVRELLDGRFEKVNKNGEVNAENLEKFEKKPLVDLGSGRLTDVPSQPKMAAAPNSALQDDISRAETRFCQKIDMECCCTDCGATDCDSDLPESFSWSQHLTLPARAPSNTTEDMVARVIANYVQLKYQQVFKESSPTLAAQQLTDCAEDWEKHFHWMGAAIRLNIQGGFELESDYQADTSDSKCRFKEYKTFVSVGTCMELNFDDENCLIPYLYKYGPLIVGLRKANWDYNKFNTDCDPVRHNYLPYILLGYDTGMDGDIWFLMSPDGRTAFTIPRGIACQDIGVYTLAIPIVKRN